MPINIFSGARRIAVVAGAIWVVGCLVVAYLDRPQRAVAFSSAGPGEPLVVSEGCERGDAVKSGQVRTVEGRGVEVRLCFVGYQTQSSGQYLVPYGVETTDVEMPDGSVISGVPSNLTRGEFAAKLKANGIAAPVLTPKESKQLAGPARGERSRSLLTGVSRARVPPAFEYWQSGPPDSDEVAGYMEAFVRDLILTKEQTATVATRHRDALLGHLQYAGLLLVAGLASGWLFVAAVGWVVRGFLGIPRGADSRPGSESGEPMR